MLKKKGLDISYYANLISSIKKSKAEVVLLHSSSYIFPAKIASLFSKSKNKIIVRETQANHLKTKMEWFWLTVSFLFASKIVFLSEEYERQIAKTLRFFFQKKKVYVIPNGLDLQLYKPERIQGSNYFIIGMQSRLQKIKDHPTLIRAFAETTKKITYKQIKLAIAGDGQTMWELRQIVSDFKMDSFINFTGTLSEEQLIPFLNSLDIYVHATLGETMSNSIMQAMACGLPVVASDVLGVNNMIINNETGILYESGNAKMLSNILIDLIKDFTKRKFLGANARKFAEDNYSNSLMFERYSRVFKNVLPTHKHFP